LEIVRELPDVSSAVPEHAGIRLPRPAFVNLEPNFTRMISVHDQKNPTATIVDAHDNELGGLEVLANAFIPCCEVTRFVRLVERK
jgi:hypothetical protein